MSKKAIAIHLTDTHATDSNLKIQESIWKQAVALSVANGRCNIFHGGDWVTARKAQSLEVLEHLVWIKDLCGEERIKLTGVSGNHCKTNQESVFAYPNLLNDDSFHIVDETHTEVFGKVRVSFMSYFPEDGSCRDKIERLVDKLKTTKKKGVKEIFVCHQGFNGGLSHKNATSNKELPIEILEFFDVVLIGHYHNRNKIENDFSTDVWYTGSTHANNYGEDNEKGFTIIYDDGSIEFVNAEFPKYETIKVELSDIDGKWMKQTKNHIKDSGNNVRLIITGDESELKKVKTAKFSDIGVKKLKKNSDSVTMRDENNKIVFVSLDKETVIKEYKKFAAEIEISDVEFGIEYLSI